MRRPLLAVVLFALFVSPAVVAQTFVFGLRGDQEVPPVATTSSGGCMGTLDQPAAQFSITCVHNVLDATVMHIHQGAPGVAGPVVFDLGDPASPVTATWTAMTPGNIADLLAGNLYINIHNAGRPNGVIRGQILPRTVDQVSFTANGAQVVPPNATSATGSCNADLSNDATSLAVQCTHNVPSPQQAHIHEAPFGQNGPVVFTFPSAASPFSANAPMTPRLVADFAATFLYLDIHGVAGTEQNPGAEIRGQIGTPPVGATTGTIHIIKASYPAGGTGFQFTSPIAPASFALNDGQSQTFLNISPGTYTFTENDPSASNFALADVRCSDTDSTGEPFARTATVRLQAGEVVDCTFRNAHAAPTDQLFVFDMTGAQEVPPSTSTHRGGCMGRFDAGSSSFTLVCAHDVVDATVMHIHHGGPGVAGAVAFDLGSPISPVIATWTGMSPADVADLLAGNLYVNIHTTGRPGGEIRGQILTRTVDTVAFTANGAQVVPPDESPATASCTADLNNAATSLAIQCTHNLPSPQAAEVHRGNFGENGPLLYTFPSAASPLSGNMPMTPRLVADFAGRFLYLDIHGDLSNEGGGGDEIRGQIGAPVAPPSTGTIRIIKQSTPAGASGFAFTDNVPGSSGSFTLADGATKEFTNVGTGTYAITESLPAGYTLTDVVCTDGDSVGNPFSRTATINLQGGEAVTCTFRNLRTYSSPTTFVFNMSSAQEVPPAPPSTHTGGCMAQFNGVNELSIVCTHDVVDATIMHIHRGAAGTSGPVVFDLGSPVSPVNATWSNMTPADVADLLAGNLYVNIHTAGRPNGAIRGQILPRTIDDFSFPMNGAQEVPPTDSTATGRCTADLSNDATSLFVRCEHNVPNPVSTHLHDAPAGSEGPVVFNFTSSSPFAGNVPMTPRLVADFEAGFLYTNIHSAIYTEGEIRGQLIAGNVPAEAAASDVPTLWESMAIALALALLGVGWRRLSA